MDENNKLFSNTPFYPQAITIDENHQIKIQETEKQTSTTSNMFEQIFSTFQKQQNQSNLANLLIPLLSGSLKTNNTNDMLSQMFTNLLQSKQKESDSSSVEKEYQSHTSVKEF